MLEIKDGKKILTTPIAAEDLADIHIGDIVYLNGSMTTCRDVAHRRLVEAGRELPVDVRDAAIFHAGPIIRPLEDDKFEMVSVGPTTSMRMEKFEKEFVEKTGVKVIIGKGGMGPNTEYGCDFHCHRSCGLCMHYPPVPDERGKIYQPLASVDGYGKSDLSPGTAWLFASCGRDFQQNRGQCGGSLCGCASKNDLQRQPSSP